MGHRYLPDSFQVLQMDQRRYRNYVIAQQAYNLMGRSFNTESGSFAQTRGNLMRSEVHFPYHATPGSSSSVYPVSDFGSEVPYLGRASSGPSFTYPSSGPSYTSHPSSSLAGNSNYMSETNAHPRFAGYSDRGIHGVLDTATAAGRAPFKRKSPDMSMTFGRGGSSWPPLEGSSSRSRLQETRFNDNQNISPYPGGFQQYSGSNRSMALNDSVRNVRIRSGLSLASTPITNHRNFVSQHFHTTNVPRNHSVAARYPCSNANANAGWNFHHMPPHGPGRIPVSDTSGLSSEANQFLVERHAVVGQCSHDHMANRNAVPPSQYHYVAPSDHRTERYRSHAHGFMPLYRERAHLSGYGYETPSSDNSVQFPAETYSSRHFRSSSRGTWHTSYLGDSARNTVERFPSLATAVDRSDITETQHHMMGDYTFSYSPRDTHDENGDMRLDIDDMSYEELLALEERIGNVDTGLSEDTMSNSLMEFLFFASEQNQEEKTCPICLEEYSDMEKVGRLRKCGHDYHVTCITKWLEMKNICPICKRSAASTS